MTRMVIVGTIQLDRYRRRALMRPVAVDERRSGDAYRDHAARNRRLGASTRGSAFTNAL